MDIAIIIGGNTGTGLAISRKLITLGFRVYAIAGDFTNTPFAHKDFFPISVQLHNKEELKNAVDAIILKEDTIYAIINAPEKNIDPPFHSTEISNLEAQLSQHLLGPILLARLAIDKIKQFQGFIINIVHENHNSPISQAIQGGLSSFYASLFEDYRNHGVNITDILVQSTADDSINYEMVANTVDHLIRFKGGNAVTKISIRPQNAQALAKFPQITPSVDEFKEIQLPPKSNFASIPEPIPTETPKRPSPKRPSVKRSPQPKISRETVVIQREKKSKTSAPLPIPPVIEKQKNKTTPQKRAPRKSVSPKAAPPEPTPSVLKISRDSIIIPREKKPRPSMPAAPVEHEEQIAIPTAVKLPTPQRIRRGRPPIKKDL